VRAVVFVAALIPLTAHADATVPASPAIATQEHAVIRTFRQELAGPASFGTNRN